MNRATIKGKRRGLAVILTLVALLLLTSTEMANAAHFTGACSAELNAVEAAIEAGTYYGKKAASSESNLLAKLEAAAAKIGLGKFDDAIDKLLDISDKATAWAGARKPKLDDATGINIAVTNAIGCVGSL